MSEEKKIKDAVEVAEEIKVETATDPAEDQPKGPKKINLQDLKLTSKNNPVERDKDIMTSIYKGRSAFQIVMPQSAYKTKVKPLSHHDILDILNDESDAYEYRRGLYYLIYNKLEKSGPLEGMTFENWLRYTSIEDIDTLFYGLYGSTFKDDGTFTMTCSKCGNEHTYTIHHTSLIHAEDTKEMDARIRQIIKEVENSEDMNKLSLVGLDEQNAFELPDSKIVAALRVPSLLDSLELLKLSDVEKLERQQESLIQMLYIHTLFAPTGDKSGYYEIKDRREIIKLVKEMSIGDAGLLINTIGDLIMEKKITYAIKQLTCPTKGCGTVYNNIPISIEDVLFTQVIEKAQLF